MENMIFIDLDILLSFQSIRDGRNIDKELMKAVSIYFDATIFIYDVTQLLKYRSSNITWKTIVRSVEKCHPNTEYGSKIFHLIDFGKTRVTSRFQSAIPKYFKEKDLFNTYVLNKESLKRWISEDGVKRKSRSIYRKIGGTLTPFVSQIISDAIVYCPSQDEKTITKHDILTVLLSTDYFERNRKKLMNGLMDKKAWKKYKRKQHEYFLNNLDRSCEMNKNGKITKGMTKR